MEEEKDNGEGEDGIPPGPFSSHLRRQFKQAKQIRKTNPLSSAEK